MKTEININRLLKDIEEGIIIVDNDGTISHINPKAQSILEINDDYIGKKYVSLFDELSKNDSFHQMIIEAISDKKESHKKRVKFKVNDNEKTLFVASSILNDEQGQQVGVILSFDDVSNEEKLKFKISTSSLMFIILVALLALWIFACAIYMNAENPINSTLFGRFIMYIPIVFTPVAIKVCGFTIEDLGLKTKNIKKYVIIDILLTVFSVGLMCLIKLLIIKLFPSFSFYTKDNQFFDFSKYTILARLEYGVCVIAQEYLSRGLVYECVRRIIATEENKKYVDTIAIIISSLYFAALHIYLGVIYMIGAFILLSIFGFIYKKQRSIWGLCIPHFILGMALEILGFTLT